MSRRKSAEQKEREGNPGRRPAEPTVDLPAGVPECPEHLDDVARAEWDRVVPILSDAGVLTAGDMAALALYCMSWSLVVATVGDVNEQGRYAESAKGIPYQSPCLNALFSAMTATDKYGSRLGLNPEARGKVKHTNPRAKGQTKGRQINIYTPKTA